MNFKSSPKKLAQSVAAKDLAKAGPLFHAVTLGHWKHRFPIGLQAANHNCAACSWQGGIYRWTLRLEHICRGPGGEAAVIDGMWPRPRWVYFTGPSGVHGGSEILWTYQIRVYRYVLLGWITWREALLSFKHMFMIYVQIQKRWSLNVTHGFIMFYHVRKCLLEGVCKWNCHACYRSCWQFFCRGEFSLPRGANYKKVAAEAFSGWHLKPAHMSCLWFTIIILAWFDELCPYN